MLGFVDSHLVFKQSYGMVKDNNTPMRRSEGGGTTAGPAFAYFYKKYLEIHPEIQRKFIMPENVKTSYINGRKEYYTEISPLPKAQIPIVKRITIR